MSQISGSFRSHPAEYGSFGAVPDYVGTDGSLLSSSTQRRRRRWVICGGLLVVVAIVAIVLGVTLGKDDTSTRSVPPASSGGVGVEQQGGDTNTNSTAAPTPAPSGAPTAGGVNSEDQLQALLPLLKAASLEDGAALSQTDPPSPQYEAATWLSADPGIGTMSDGRKITRYALSTLYRATSSAVGSQWNDVGGWDQLSLDECEWNGVECRADGAVTMLNVTFNNIRGELPLEVLMLKNLGECWQHFSVISLLDMGPGRLQSI